MPAADLGPEGLRKVLGPKIREISAVIASGYQDPSKGVDAGWFGKYYPTFIKHEIVKAMEDLAATVWPDALVLVRDKSKDIPRLLQLLPAIAPTILIDPPNETYVDLKMPIVALTMVFIRDGNILLSTLYSPMEKILMVITADKVISIDGVDVETEVKIDRNDVSVEEMKGLVVKEMVENCPITDEICYCPAMAYRALAVGKAYYLLMDELSPWDHAAGLHMVEALGLYAAHVADGTPCDWRNIKGTFLVTRTKKEFEEISPSFREFLLLDGFPPSEHISGLNITGLLGMFAAYTDSGDTCLMGKGGEKAMLVTRNEFEWTEVLPKLSTIGLTTRMGMRNTYK